MSKQQNITIGVIGYVLLALITFGHSAAEGEREYKHCAATRDPGYVGLDCGGYVPIALFSAVFWPLYLSWELQS